MGELRFSGGSDDLVELEGLIREEYGAYEAEPAIFEVGSRAGRQLLVYAHYGKESPCWYFAVGMIDEDVRLPEWPIKIENGHGYSTSLVIEIPEGVEGIYVSKIKTTDGML